MALWNLNMVSIGRSAHPISEELLSVSQTKRLESIDGAEELKDKERKDLAVARELNPRLLLFTPKPGTQQGRSVQHCFWASIVSEGSGALLPLQDTETCLLNGLSVSPASADSVLWLLSLVDNVEARAQDDLPKFSSISAKLLAGQQPVAFGDKQKPWLRALHAQPEKSVTKAISELGAESKNYCQI
jgi:hypothetical protein